MNKQKKLFILLCSVFASVVIFSIILCASGASTLITVIGYLPSILGRGLRSMSLSGAFGNIVAILIYFLLAVSPLTIPLVHGIKHKRIDTFYCAYGCIGAATLFFVIYMAINPAVLLKQFTFIGESVDAVSNFAFFMLAILSLSIVIACLVCELTRKKSHLMLSKDVILVVLACIILIGFSFPIFFESLVQIWHMKDTYSSAAGLEFSITAQYLLTVVGFLVNCGRLTLFTICLWLALSLFLSMNKKIMDEAEKNLAQRLNKLLKISLLLSALSYAFLNVLQLLLIKWLLDINIVAYIPTEIFIYTASLIISKYVVQSVNIKKEQDLTI